MAIDSNRDLDQTEDLGQTKLCCTTHNILLGLNSIREVEGVSI
jgi:hypothetical protein